MSRATERLDHIRPDSKRVYDDMDEARTETLMEIWPAKAAATTAEEGKGEVAASMTIDEAGQGWRPRMHTSRYMKLFEPFLQGLGSAVFYCDPFLTLLPCRPRLP